MSNLANPDGMAGARFKAAAVQMVSASEVETNLARADALGGSPAGRSGFGVGLIVLYRDTEKWPINQGAAVADTSVRAVEMTIL
jgi:hypothetical protein